MSEPSDRAVFSESRDRDDDGNEVIVQRVIVRETEAGFPARPTGRHDILVHWQGIGPTRPEPPGARDGDVVEWVDRNLNQHSIIVGAR